MWIYRAAQWLQANQDQFRGKIHPPIMTLIEMKDPKNAYLIENSIPFRDITTFVAEKVQFAT